MLYVVSTPIGNLKDITLRAIEILKAADFIVAENPKNSLKLLKYYEIPNKKIIQFAEHNEQRVLSTIISQLSTQSGAIITDAGTPGISDPGFRLVRECIKNGIPVIPIPGASSAMAALSASGFPTDRFLFLGFMPRTPNKILKGLETVQQTESTGIAFESPYRILKTITLIAANFPSAKVIVARELTKAHEEFIRGTAKEVLDLINQQTKVRGEITLLISFKDF